MSLNGINLAHWVKGVGLDQPLERLSVEPEEALFADVIRPLFRYYWLVLVFAVVGGFAAFGLSSYEPITYSTESMMVVDGSYADQKLITDLAKDQGAGTNVLSGGLIRLKFSASSPEEATRRLNTIMETTQARLLGLMPDYEDQITLAKEQYLELIVIVNEAGTMEQRIILSNLLVDNLRKLDSLIRKDRNKNNALRIVKEPSVPVASAPPDYLNRIGLGAAFGLMLGALAAYVLYNKDALFRFKKAL